MAARTSLYTGRLVVRLALRIVEQIRVRAQNPALPDLASLTSVGETLHLVDLQGFFHGHPNFTSFAAIRGTKASVIAAREARARDSRFPPLRSLLAYYTIDPRRDLTKAQLGRLVADLNAMPSIELAIPELCLRAPIKWAVNPTDPMVTDQSYLADAPDGIGANNEAVWGAYDGAGIGFVDLESGWNLSHQDLPKAVNQPQPLLNANDPAESDHGTCVLGVVLGQPAGAAGVNGIAPKAKFLGVVSRANTPQQDEWDVVAAVSRAMDVMTDGDVLLVEVETQNGYPVETDDAIFDAIRLAAGNDLIVIEPAGNGTLSAGRDLDKPLFRTSPAVAEKNRAIGKAVRLVDRTLNPNAGAAFQDSGAILVSSCQSKTTPGGAHKRTSTGGYGARVDCYAWGEDVVTAGIGDYPKSSKAENKLYTGTFNGTSAAAAIIAGATLLIQQMAVQIKGRRLNPTQLRALVSDTRGTDVLRGARTIGVMPDLPSIVAALSAG